ncbi:hypothetical protein BLNAU_16788 [Blattamonas nauphoetae]|uniref:Uncharacterized protein n=1 Tax=Blattamonas nauphoetae TaxID=2049346 RepID=A0ABQ9XC68_9EUKA|nr:hypothetical protein BLNAU_16788 [Blattamonas nauphoetae]
MAEQSNQHDPTQPEMRTAVSPDTVRDSSDSHTVGQRLLWQLIAANEIVKTSCSSQSSLHPVSVEESNFECQCDFVETLIGPFAANVVRSLDAHNPCVLMCQCENDPDRPETAELCQVSRARQELWELTRTLTAVAPFSTNAETALLPFVNAPLTRSPPASSPPPGLPAGLFRADALVAGEEYTLVLKQLSCQTRSIHSALLQTDFDACLCHQVILVLSTIMSSFSLTHPVEKAHPRLMSIFREVFGEQPVIRVDELATTLAEWYSLSAAFLGQNGFAGRPLDERTISSLLEWLSDAGRLMQVFLADGGMLFMRNISSLGDSLCVEIRAAFENVLSRSERKNDGMTVAVLSTVTSVTSSLTLLRQCLSADEIKQKSGTIDSCLGIWSDLLIALQKTNSTKGVMWEMLRKGPNPEENTMNAKEANKTSPGVARVVQIAPLLGGGEGSRNGPLSAQSARSGGPKRVKTTTHRMTDEEWMCWGCNGMPSLGILLASRLRTTATEKELVGLLRVVGVAEWAWMDVVKTDSLSRVFLRAVRILERDGGFFVGMVSAEEAHAIKSERLHRLLSGESGWMGGVGLGMGRPFARPLIERDRTRPQMDNTFPNVPAMPLIPGWMGEAELTWDGAAAVVEVSLRMAARLVWLWCVLSRSDARTEDEEEEQRRLGVSEDEERREEMMRMVSEVTWRLLRAGVAEVGFEGAQSSDADTTRRSGVLAGLVGLLVREVMKTDAVRATRTMHAGDVRRMLEVCSAVLKRRPSTATATCVQWDVMSCCAEALSTGREVVLGPGVGFLLSQGL